MSAVEDLRQRVSALADRERSIVERLRANAAERQRLREEETTLAAELARVQADHALAKENLIEEAKRDTRLRFMPDEAPRHVIARLGTFVMGELVAELDGDKKKAKRVVDALLAGKPPLLTVDRLGRQKLYTYAGPPPEPKPADAATEARRQRAKALERVRDWVVMQADVFTPAQAAFAAELDRDEALELLRKLADTGVVSDESPTADMPLFRYDATPVADLAAQRDAKRQREQQVRERSTPVAGTGRGLRAGNKDVQGLIDAAIAAGASVTRAGSDHFAVEYPGAGRVIIASTPSSQRTIHRDRAKLRSAGIAI